MGFTNSFVNGYVRLSYPKVFVLVTAIFLSFVVLISRQNVSVPLINQVASPANGKFCINKQVEISFTPCDLVGEVSSIVKTLQFMLKDVEQDDPALVDFVRTLIKPPSKLPINLIRKDKSDFSQIGQSMVMDQAFKSKRDGFFVESGGYNGEDFSNTLFFELKRNWSGILIEPITELYNDLVKKNRNIYSINACIAGSKPFVAKLRVAGPLSGREEAMAKQHKDRINSETKTDATTGSYLYIPCFSLYTILKAINVNKVDYFSLDIEGGEWDVIKSLPYDKIDIRSFTIEYPANPGTTDFIKSKLADNGYNLFKQDGSDLYYLKK
jgi:hypothetical protein